MVSRSRAARRFAAGVTGLKIIVADPSQRSALASPAGAELGGVSLFLAAFLHIRTPDAITRFREIA